MLDENNQCIDYRRLRNTEGRLASQVPRTVRFDGKDHWPHCFSVYTNRHRSALCRSLTNMYCIKCQVHLCCHAKRNCFTPFHTEDKNRVIHLPTLPHSDSDQEKDLDEPDTESALSELDSLSF